MTVEDIIREVQENAAEWIEMSEDPSAFVVGVLANKIIKLEGYIEYLERRVKDASKC